MANQDFPQGLKDADAYLNRTVEIPTNVTVDPTTGTVTQNTTSYTMREIICSILAGNGFKLPNIQICIKANLGRLLNNAGINWQGALADLYDDLKEAEEELEKFIASTDIENVLGKINAAVAEFAAIANMINFCGTPIEPRAIPNVLRDMFGSFTGEGKKLLDNLGTLADSDIGGCIDSSGAFKPIFNGGVLGQIQNNLSNLANLPQSTIDGFRADLQAFSNDMRNLIEFENNFGNGSTTSKGGSNFAPTTRINNQIGVGIDPANMDLATAQRIGGNLKASYDQLKAYEVDGQGNNIFHYILEPEMIARLEQGDDPIAGVDNRVPTYDYCGRIIGYTDVPLQSEVARSAGSPAVVPSQPGVEALGVAGQQVHSDPHTTTNLNTTGQTTTTTTTPSTGSGIALTNLSVTQNSANGNGTLTYNNITGVFTYTPPVIPAVPTVPTNVSAFTNDAGYITNSAISNKIARTDLSVTQNAASGTGALTYNNISGVFTYTPPDLSNLGGGGTAYDQSLNTTDSVTFNSVTTNSFNVTGTGTSTFTATEITLDASNRTKVDGSPFRLAQMTTAQVNAIAAPQAGDMVFNTDTSKAQCYDGTTWQNLF